MAKNGWRVMVVGKESKKKVLWANCAKLYNL